MFEAARRIESHVLRLPTTAREAGVLLKTGFVPMTRPNEAAAALRSVRQWGIVAGSARMAAHRHPDALGLVDEIGELTFGQLDKRSNALARAWRQHDIDETSVLALLCRDHRGLVESMIAAAKLGARVLLMNTGFAGPQLTAVAEREQVTAFVYDR
ncbi:MAG TPA: AMP-binding protein, partial [Jatrophihabitantaceae bacterium]|nr:AMP-binding protein [Jatrophihabitantaceae bacterium]